MAEAVIDQLKQIIANELDVNLRVEEIDSDAPLFEGGLGLDSVVIVEFITLIEERFEFRFSENELSMELFQNLRTVAQTVSGKLETNPS